jgi:ABC-type Fe3+ transport system substrate-binding protein
MASFADLLDPADRQRLAALGSPPSSGELAASARAAAADSDGSGRVAWLLVATALDRARDTTEARTVLAGMVEDEGLRATAIACLAALRNGSASARTAP